MDIALRVIPEPSNKNSSFFHYRGEKEHFGAFVAGSGGDNYVCGNCGAILCKDIDRERDLALQGVSLKSLTKDDIVFLCPFCGDYNALSQ